MNINNLLWVGIAALLACAAELSAREATSSLSQDEARQLSLISPTSFPELPSTVLMALEAHGCKIPQPYYEQENHNVISGEFIQPGQTDWAALCVKDGEISLLVFPRGLAPPLIVTGPWEETVHIEEIGQKRWWYGFNNVITAVGAKTIEGYYQAYGGGGPELPPITHHGIDLYCCERASTIYYLHNDIWLQLPGAD